MTDTPSETRTFAVVYVSNDTSDRSRQNVEAAYYRRDGSLLEFKDAKHRVVFAVAVERVLTVTATDAQPKAASADRGLPGEVIDQMRRQAGGRL
jgi:hypothetical protein